MRVLHIEDNTADAFLLQELLKTDSRLTYQVTHVRTFAAGLSRLEAHEVDLVLLDHGLPDVVGFGGLDELRRMYPDIPVVVLSGNDDGRQIREAFAHGAQDYWVKGGMDIAHLGRMCERAIWRQAYVRHCRGDAPP